MLNVDKSITSTSWGNYEQVGHSFAPAFPAVATVAALSSAAVEEEVVKPPQNQEKSRKNTAKTRKIPSPAKKKKLAVCCFVFPPKKARLRRGAPINEEVDDLLGLRPFGRTHWSRRCSALPMQVSMRGGHTGAFFDFWVSFKGFKEFLFLSSYVFVSFKEPFFRVVDMRGDIER